jgi:hypothetical protein
VIAVAVLSALLAPVPPPRVPTAPPDGAIKVELPVAYEPPVVEAAFDFASLAAVDRPVALALAEAVQQRRPLGEAEIVGAERLFGRNRASAAAVRLLRAVHVLAAEQARAANRRPEAAEHLRRAAAIAPEPRVEIDVVALFLQQGDWPEAEREARGLMAARPEQVDGPLGLAFALLRQDRPQEALEPARAAQKMEDSPRSKRVLALVLRALASENGLNEARRWHFHLLYEGPPNPELGQVLLERLEQHYANLVGVFEYEPTTTIPVILFTQERYHAVTGAPHWSGGAYNALDGRIRVPAGGLSAAALSEIDGTLVHELAHAFIAERTGGLAPRFLHEGLAQYVEGDRVGSRLSFEELGALADGRLGGVGGFYVEALSFAEFLVQQQGQRAVNDALAAVGETGDLEAGFRQVYGKGYEALRTEWRAWARIQYR